MKVQLIILLNKPKDASISHLLCSKPRDVAFTWEKVERIKAQGELEVYACQKLYHDA